MGAAMRLHRIAVGLLVLSLELAERGEMARAERNWARGYWALHCAERSLVLLLEEAS